MITDLKKSIVLTAALAAPLLLTAPAQANDTTLVNHQAVNQFTRSVQDTLAAYDSLLQGDTAAAQSKLDQALRNIESAMAKDPTLGFSEKSGSVFHSDLKMIKAKLRSNDRVQAQSELNNVLSSAGIITAS